MVGKSCATPRASEGFGGVLLHAQLARPLPDGSSDSANGCRMESPHSSGSGRFEFRKVPRGEK